MAVTFFFYDLETSGVNPATSRIMQFAGQRTTLDLNPVGEPVDVLVKLSADCVPDPDAILITGITPQKTLAEGLSEAQFLHLFHEQIAIDDTIFVGFNTVRFDDEFMRYANYRNFYDPYEWQWKDGRSRWDLLDTVRMTRALRPNGVTWPFDTNGKPTNRLELLTSVNNLDHMNAHDALSDVNATISVARLLKDTQPKLFAYLLQLRDKKQVSQIVLNESPFVYTCGKYPSEFEKTAIVQTVMKHPKKQAALVYDLRYDPAPFVDLSPEELVDLWKWSKDPNAQRLPVKTLQFNRCPAIAPLQVLDAASQKRLKVNMVEISTHSQFLRKAVGFTERLTKALDILDSQQASFKNVGKTVDEQLYDKFIPDVDRMVSSHIRTADVHEITEFSKKLVDPRLQSLLPLYKARNFPDSLDTEERLAWEHHCSDVLLYGGQSSNMAKFFARLGELSESNLTESQNYLLEELQLYGQSVMPASDDFES